MNDSKENYNLDTLEAIEMTQCGKDMYGPFSSVEELMDVLNADD